MEKGISEILEAVRTRRMSPEEGRARLAGRSLDGAGRPNAAAPADIAVIGMSARLPKAPDMERFWENLTSGHDAIEEVPPGRWDPEPYFSPTAEPGTCCSRWGGFLPDIEHFDPLFFNISPREAEMMDPQQRVFLEEVWKALEDAGYGEADVRGRRCSVFVGCKHGDYQIPDAVTPHSLTAQSTAIIAARVSYHLNLKGPSIPVNTACSSSLVAIALACDSLASGACEMAIAGGVALMLSPKPHLVLGQAGMLSPGGRCRTFDRDADGIAPGEGAAAVLLKPLRAAQRDGDRILAVIKGYATNHDGKTNGITAPSGPSQTELLLDAWDRFGIDPRTIGYVEAHGTGTRLGDPIEVNALTDAFRRFTAERGFCALGSVKTNIGHTLEAAGMAGLAKVLLCLRHGKLVPTLHFASENPLLALGDSPFHVNTRLTDWIPPAGVPRRAAVSAFGMNGTNGHVVVEEAPPEPHRPDPATQVRLFCFSARTAAALDRVLGRFAAWLSGPGAGQRLDDIAHTLQRGRSHFPFRAAAAAASADELLRCLGGTGTEPSGMARGRAGKPDGAEAARAGELALRAAAEDGQRPVLEELARLYVAGCDLDWTALARGGHARRIALPSYPFEREVCWLPQTPQQGPSGERPSPPPAAGPGPVVQVRTLRPGDPLVHDHRIDGVPVLPGVAFLDLAYAALARTADPLAFSLVDVVWSRLLAVGPDPVELRTTIEPDGPALRVTVATGAVDTPVEHFSARFVPTAPAPEPSAIAGILARCPRRTDRGAVYAGCSAIIHGPRFQTLGQVWVGEAEVLGRLAAPAAQAASEPPALLDPGLADGALQAVAAVGPGGRAMAPFAAGRVEVFGPIPGDAFTHVRRVGTHRYDVAVLDEAGRCMVRFGDVAMRPLAMTSPAGTGENAPAGESLFFLPRWTIQPAPPTAAAAPASGTVLVVHPPDCGGLDDALAARQGGAAVHWIPLGADGGDDPAALDRALDAADLREPLAVLFLGGIQADYAAPDDLAAQQQAEETGVIALFRLVKALLARGWGNRALALTVATADVLAATPDTPLRPFAGGLHGFVRSLIRECADWSLRCIDLSFSDIAADPGATAEQLLGEPWQAADSGSVALRQGYRYVRRLLPAALPPARPTFRRGGTYLIAGGAGGIGLVLARHLAANYGASLALIGRRAADDGLRRTLAGIEAMGGRIMYLQADLTDLSAMQGAVARVRAEFGTVHGVIHSAIVLADHGIARMTETELRAVLAPKTRGSLVLYRWARELRPDFLMFFSSIQSCVGNAGQANYAAACTAKDAFADAVRRREDWTVTTINWGYWGHVGIVADEATRQRLANHGVRSIEPEEGLAAIERALGHALPQATVFKAEDRQLGSIGIDLSRRLALSPAGPAVGAVPADPPPVDAVLAGRIVPLLEAADDLDALGALLLLATFRRAGVFLAVGERHEEAALLQRLAIRPSSRRLFRAWLAILRRAGLIEPMADGWRTTPRLDSPPVREVLADPGGARKVLGRRIAGIDAYLDLLEACMAAVLEVASGRRSATDVLFPGGSTRLVQGIYGGDPVVDFHNDLVARILVAQVRERLEHDAQGRVAILEIGAGTGGTTRRVLPSLARFAGRIDYYYTDISPALVRHGEQAFAAEFPFIEFRALDIEKNPGSQGIEPARMDVVLASNVLHATRRMTGTLDAVKRLLRRGGAVIINEITTARDFATLTFGQTDGWWLFDDAELRLEDSPLLARETWAHLLRAAGFNELRMTGLPASLVPEPPQTVMVAISDGLAVSEAAVNRPALPAALPAAVPVPVPVAESGNRGDPTQATARAAGGDRRGRLIAFIREILAEILKIRPAAIDAEEPFDAYGVDSLIVLDINKRFEPAFGRLPATLLFEHMTVAMLADHFLRDHREAVERLLPTPAAALPARAPTPAGGGPRAGDIAVIGLSGRYPMADTPEAFWDNLKAGRDCISEIPAERWDWRTVDGDDARREWSSYSRWGGFLTDVDKFDPLFFGIPPNEADAMDPQERLFLETVWTLAERTGHTRRALARQNPVGVFVGVMNSNYEWMGGQAWAEGRRSGAHSSFWSIANRVSYLFDFQGPSLAVDTACSASLTAIHLACESLRRGECRLAVAGGVNLILSPVHYLRLCRVSMLSKGRECRSFGAGADGFVDGEGVGAVLLKPLDRAQADGDRIEAVIRGSSINAGGRTSGYTVPNPNAQAAVVAATLRDAGIDPRSIGYVEAHGTGTALGDPIEIAGLRRAFEAATTDRGFCAIGSVKSNIGHLESGAGIAALTKVVLQLRHRELVPSLHARAPNPHIRFEETPFRLQRDSAPWPKDAAAPRRAGISSFGAGGANAHLLVEEYPAAETGGPAGDGMVLVPLSARTPDRLDAMVRRLLDFLEANPGTDLRDIAYTLQVGREGMDERLALLVRDVGGLRRLLSDLREGPDVRRGSRRGRDADAPGTDGEALRRIDEDGLRRLADRWVAGAEVDWLALNEGGPGRRIVLPTYPFARNRHWLPDSPAAVPAAPASLPPDAGSAPDRSGVGATADPVFLVPDWQPVTAAGGGEPASAGGILVVYPPELRRAAVEMAAAWAGRPVRFLDTAEAAEEPAADRGIGEIVFLADAGPAGPEWDRPEPDHDGEGGIVALFRLVQTLLASGRETDRLVLRIVTRNLCPLGTAAPPCGAELPAFVLSLAREVPEWRIGCIDLRDDDLAAGASPVALLRLGAEIAAAPEQAVTAVRGHRHYRRTLQPLALPPAGDPVFRPGGVYWIIGGAGAVGRAASLELARRAGARLAWSGRGPLTPEIADAIAAIGAVGGEAIYLQADAADQAAMAAVAAAIRARFGALHGVIHCAMAFVETDCAALDEAALRAALMPKVAGTLALREALAGSTLDFLAFFSSAQAFLGNRGRAHYGAACAAGDAAAAALARDGGIGPVVTVNWGFWDTGVVRDAAVRAGLERQGVRPLAPAAAMAALERLLSHKDRIRQVVVLDVEPRVLDAMGVDRRGGVQLQPPGLPPSLGTLAAEFAAVPVAPADFLHHQARLQDLGPVSRLGVLRAFQRMGVLRAAGGTDTVGGLARRIGLAPRHARLFEALLDLLARAGFVGRTGQEVEGAAILSDPGLATQLATFEADAARAAPDLRPYMALLLPCLEALPHVLTGRRAATDVVFPEGGADLVTPIYRGNPIADFYNTLLAASVRRFVEARLGAHDGGRPVTIVEVGAGIGGTSALLLPALAAFGPRLRYVYTDISPALVRHGEAAFSAAYPFVEFRVLDIEDAAAQGLAPADADLIVAANVMHATTDIAATLRTLKALLKAGGWLVLNEMTDVQDFITVTFGLLDGWWAYRDTGRRLPHSPLLDGSGWRVALEEEGFSPVTAATPAGLDPGRLNQQILIGESDGVVRPRTPRPRVAATPPPTPSGPLPLDAPPEAPLDARAAVQAALAGILGAGSGDLDPDTPFAAYGVDSLLAMDLVRQINGTLGVALRSTDIFSHPTVAKLAAHVGAMSRDQQTPVPSKATVPAAVPTGADTDIAVIGMSGRFPGAPDIPAFWRNLVAGRDSVGPLPADRRALAGLADVPESDLPVGGFLTGIDAFDPLFFQISPREAVLMDPQQRLFLEESWKALEDAGYAPATLNEARCGVFVGCEAGGGYQDRVRRVAASDPLAFTGSARSILPARVAYHLNLRGPCLAIDCACSSSLVALHTACESLLAGSCDMAIAGGVSLLIGLDGYTFMRASGLLSRSGTCRTFDHRADGIVPAESVCALVLKPLAAALRDGDPIHGVIRGAAINHDGRSNGLTAPSGPAQAGLEAGLYRRFGIDPGEIGYVEAHGTGTELGDPIEVAALTEAFREFTPRTGFCAIGSVKTNVGHALAASGLVGVVKVLLALQHGQIPASLHFEAENPQIGFAATPFTVQAALGSWPSRAGRPRLGAVSSFGFSGTNAHVVLAEAPHAAAGQLSEEPGPFLVCLSGRTVQALERRMTELGQWLAGHPDASLSAISFTLLCGRAHFAERIALVVRDRADLMDRLGTVRPGATPCPDAAPLPPAAAGQRIAAARAGGADGRDALEHLADHYLAGGDAPWRSLFDAAAASRRISLPPYPFARDSYWIDAPRADPAPAADLFCLAPHWTEADWTEADGSTSARTASGAPILLLDHGSGKAAALRAALGNAGPLILVEPGTAVRRLASDHWTVRPGHVDDWALLFGRLSVEAGLPQAVVHRWVDGAGTELTLVALAALTTALLDLQPDASLRLLCVVPARADPAAAACCGALSGFGAVLAAEQPGLRCRILHGGEASHIVGELARPWRDGAEVRWNGAMRQIRRFRVQALSPSAEAPLRPGGVCLITGGAGAIGHAFARDLARTRGARLVLLGRRPADAAIRARLTALEQAGGQALYLQADVADSAALRQALDATRRRFGPIDGVIHSAGIVRDALLSRKPVADLARVAAPKVAGTLALDEATAGDPLSFFLMFSSASAVLGNAGQADYAFGNAFMDHYALAREAMRQEGRRSGATLSIAWPLWEDGGMAADAATRTRMEQAGMRPLVSRDGVDLCWQALASGQPRLLAYRGDPARLPEQLAPYLRPAPPPSPAVVPPPAELPAAELPAAEMPAAAAPEGLVAAAAAGLKVILAEELGLPAERIDSRARLDQYGLESLLIMKVNARLEQAAGQSFPKTLLFRYHSVQALAEYLAGAHPEGCRRAFARWLPAAPPPTTPAVRPAQPSRPAPDGDEPIAVIGLAGRYPNAGDLDVFWRLLRDGHSAIAPIPADRWDEHAYYDPDPEQAANGRMYCRWGGFLDRVDRFDPLFFGISPREAEMMDPQERLFLQIAWAALEDAGYTRERLRAAAPSGHGADVGVFAGVTTQSYQLFGPEEWLRGNPVLPMSLPWSLCNRISFIFNFTGPSLPVDTACSSSLVALHVACESLRRRECRFALAGGVNLYLHPSKFVGMCRGKMLSPTGRIHAFGAGADGFVPGEGVGAVLLRPLPEAVAAGDRIAGVILGSAVNHGGRSNGYSVPNPAAQEALIEAALARAGVDPRTVGYVEAHGTGTALGDPIEVAALNAAYRRPGAGPVALGTVKPNIGHAESAAGIAGLTKVLLQMRHGELVPTLNAEPPNPRIDFADGPFHVQRQAASWQRPVVDGVTALRRAAVSSFGAGGVNAHVILEEPPAMPSAAPAGDQPELILLSARSPDRLTLMASRLAESLERSAAAVPRLADIAFTLQVGREPFDARLAIVAHSLDDLLGKLHRFATGRDGSDAETIAGHRTHGAAAASLWETLGELDETATIVDRLLATGRMEALGRLWAGGIDIDWSRLPRPPGTSSVALPTYPFAEDRCWFRTAPPGRGDGVTGPGVPGGPAADGEALAARYRQVVRLLANREIDVDNAQHMLTSALDS